MKKKIAKLLRLLADKLDPQLTEAKLNKYMAEAQEAGGVVENESPNYWHPEQDGNVIESEPPLITKARRDGNLPDM